MDTLLDTGPVVALGALRDPYHVQARAYMRTPQLRLVTSSIIIAEAYTLLRRREGYRLASDVVRSLRASQVVRVHHVDEPFDRDIWAAIDEFAGVRLSYADASLVVLGRRLRIRQAFSFDEDLRSAGFELVPQP